MLEARLWAIEYRYNIELKWLGYHLEDEIDKLKYDLIEQIYERNN